MREQAMRVDEVMREVQGAMEKARSEVWPEQRQEEGATEEGVDGQQQERRPRGADGVYWESQQELEGDGVRSREAPEVKIWKGGEMFAA